MKTETLIERTKGIFFIDKGDSPEETLLRIELSYNDETKETFDVCSFACDETENAEANAAFICKAVNNYEDAIAALKDMIFLADTSERNFTKLWLKKIELAKNEIKRAEQ